MAGGQALLTPNRRRCGDSAVERQRSEVRSDWSDAPTVGLTKDGKPFVTYPDGAPAGFENP
jgi:hypothetical protein